MGSIIMQVFLYTFFVYGVVTFVDQIIDRLHSDPCAVYVDTILLVKDQEDTIEFEINNTAADTNAKNATKLMISPNVYGTCHLRFSLSANAPAKVEIKSAMINGIKILLV